MVKFTIFVVGGSLLIAAGLICGLPYLNQGGGTIIVEPLEYDAGTVSMADGLIEYRYEISNIGQQDLEINRIWTSCMCTTARLKVGDKESPEFGMHNNPVLWSQKLAPGEKGYLEVVFDQAFHGPEGTGEIVRVIYISSSDAQKPKTEVRLIANVVE